MATPKLGHMVAPQNWLAAHLGPVEIVFLALPGDAVPQAWQALLSAVDAHQLRLLDLEFVRRGEFGAEILNAEQLPGVVLPEFAGSSSQLLTAADLDAVVPNLANGELAAVMLVEHLTMLEVIHAFEAVGSRLVLDGSLDAHELDAALADAGAEA